MPLSAISGISNSISNAFSRPSIKDTALQNTKASEAGDQKEAKLNPNKTTNFIDKLLPQLRKEKPSKEAMQNRLNDIALKGKILLEHPTRDSVGSYIKDMKDFLGDVKDHAHNLKHKDGLFQRIEIADIDLDKLSEELLKEQKAELALVNSLGQLQGLLVDVFV